MRLKNGLVLLIMLLSFTYLNASVYDFLDVGISARANAMAGGFSAVSNDIDMLSWNPSGIHGIEKGMLSTSLLLYVADIKFGQLQYGFGKGKNTLGFKLGYVNYGTMEKRGINNEDLGSLTPMNILFISGLSHSISEDLSAGIGLKFVYEKIDSFISYGAGVDMGIQYFMRERNLTFGVVSKNLGKEIKAHSEEKGSFPFSITGGVSFHPIDAINLNFDLTRTFSDSKSIAKLGAEWWVIPMFALRAGYSNAGEELKTDYGSDIFCGISCGFGVSWKNMCLDYAILPKGDLGLSHSISISHIF